MERGPISKFITHHYRHFNSATLVDAAKAYDDLMNRGGKMMLAMAGAMSTAELGISLAESSHTPITRGCPTTVT